MLQKISTQHTQIARLFSFLVAAERLAHDCALAQAAIAPDSGAHRFLLAQARQEAFHARVFQGAISWLAPRGINSDRSLLPMTRYRALLEDAIRRRDFPETLLAQQVILEGLGDVVLDRISAGMTERGMGFTRLRRTLLNQEHAHHIFGLRRLEQLINTGRASAATLRERGKEYLALTDAILAVQGDLFETFNEDPTAYASAARHHLPSWLTEDETRE